MDDRSQVGAGRGKVSWALSIILAASVSNVPAPAQEIVREDFDGPESPAIELPGAAPNACARTGPVAAGENPACLDDLGRQNGGPGTGRLVLTRYRNEVGHAWVRTPLRPEESRISIAFDLFVENPTRGATDGFSFVLLEGGVPGAPGRGGAGLGTGGIGAEHLSVALDFRDDGPLDPESPCDDAFSASTCHLEVNVSSDPAKDPSIATSFEIPDVFAAGKAGAPIRFAIDLNERELAVELESALEGYGRRRAIHIPLERFSPEECVAGFVASAGSSNVAYAVDGLLIALAPLEPPEIVWDAERDRGGLDCGGDVALVELWGETIALAADGAYGSSVRVEAGPPTLFVLRSGGRAPTWHETDLRLPGPVSALPSPEWENVLGTAVSSPLGLRYLERVVPGRYDVRLFWAEPRPVGFGALPAERRFDVEVQGTPVLRFFSPARAAAAGLGACGAAHETAVAREFSVDAPAGLIEIRVRDLGGGDTPGDALLGGYAFRRSGEATGEPPSGDLEDSRRPEAAFEDSFREILHLDFDAPSEVPSQEIPPLGTATVNGGRFFRPGLADGRLRLADDGALLNVASVIFDGGGSLVFDPLAVALRIELDVYVSNPDGGAPGEGFVVGIVAGDDPSAIGAPGAGLGFHWIGSPGIGVELDLSEGGGFGDDSGYDTDGQAHLAIVGSGAAFANVDHVQDMNDFDPSLDREAGGWIDWLAPEGVRLEILYRPEARVEVYAEAKDGSFPRRKVLDSFVTPFAGNKALLGLFAATSAKTATIEVDDLRVSAAGCLDGDEEASIAGPPERTLLLEPGGVAVEEFDGSGSVAGPGEEHGLRYSWSVDGPLDGAEIASPCRPATAIAFSSPGAYRVILEVDDLRCGKSPAGTREVTVLVREGSEGGTFIRGDSNADGKVDISDAVNSLSVLFLGAGALDCRDAADANDDGRLDISDAVYALVYLFLGGEPPPEPSHSCGGDPSEDRLDCADFPPCR
ncbi:MAG: hypothetical protein ACUVYA_10820 [Planctomycetota bacterium]